MATHLYKTITVDTQISTTECYLDGIELSNTSNTNMKVYDITNVTPVAGNLVSTTQTTAYNRQCSITFPKGGIKMQGIWVDWTAGTGTVYYHY